MIQREDLHQNEAALMGVQKIWCLLRFAYYYFFKKICTQHLFKDLFKVAHRIKQNKKNIKTKPIPGNKNLQHKST